MTVFQKIFKQKYFYAFLSILALSAYSMFVFAAPPSTQFNPGQELDPSCDPESSNCSVAVPWLTDQVNGYVYSNNALHDNAFIFGDDDMEWTSGTEAKIYLDRENSAVRIGAVDDATWDAGSADVGEGTVAIGFPYLIYGAPIASGQNAVAIGTASVASGFNSFAFAGATAAGSNSFALGFGSQATNSNAMALGFGTIASGENAITLGFSGTTASGDQSVAIGNNSVASGDYSTVMGEGLLAPGGVELALGAFNTSYTPQATTSWDDDDRLVVVGNGSISSARSDAFTILKNGKIGAGIDNFENTSYQLNGGTPLLQVGGLMAASGSYTGLVTDANKAAHFFNTDIIPDASVNRSEYYGINSVVTYDPNSSGLDLSYSGASGVNEANSNITAGFFRAVLAGTGDVRRSVGSSSSVTINGTGAYNRAAGSESLITLNSASTLSDAVGVSAQILPFSGTMSRTVGFSANINGDIASSGTKKITDAIGSSITIRNTTGTASGITLAAAAASNTPGISSDGIAYGIRIDNSSAASAAAISGATAYGIYMSGSSITGSSAEYALYLNDAEAQNYFRNGLRVGTDSDDSKIDDATSGSGSTQLYIGTNTIDTTAPSDQRTKQNIQDTAYGIETLNDIRVVDFIYKQSIIDDDEMQHTGVLAQQVRSLYPEAVSTRSDGFMMVDYKTFIPLIIKSVQDLNIKIQDVEAIASTVTPAMFAEIRTWLGDMTNGIETIYAKVFKGDEIDVKTMCVSDDTGSKTCITKNQLDALLEGIGSEIDNNSNDEPVDQQVNNESEDQGTDEPQDNQNMENPVLEAPEENSQENPEPEITDESTTTEPQTEPVQEDSSTENTASDTQSTEASI